MNKAIQTEFDLDTIESAAKAVRDLNDALSLSEGEASAPTTDVALGDPCGAAYRIAIQPSIALAMVAEIRRLEGRISDFENESPYRGLPVRGCMNRKER